jgi:hypothetical protein
LFVLAFIGDQKIYSPNEVCRLYNIEWYDDWCIERDWNEALVSELRYYPGVWIEGWRKTMKTLTLDKDVGSDLLVFWI